MINNKLFGAIHTLIRKKFSQNLPSSFLITPKKNQSYKYLTRVECEALDRILSLTNEMYRVKKDVDKRPLEKILIGLLFFSYFRTRSFPTRDTS